MGKKEKKSNIYIVEKIVGKIVKKGKPFYIVKWEGYSSDQNTEEPLSNLKNVMHMVKQFDEQHKENVQSEEKVVEKVQNKKKGFKKVANPTNKKPKNKVIQKVPMISQSKKIKKVKFVKEPQQIPTKTIVTRSPAKKIQNLKLEEIDQPQPVINTKLRSQSNKKEQVQEKEKEKEKEKVVILQKPKANNNKKQSTTSKQDAQEEKDQQNFQEQVNLFQQQLSGNTNNLSIQLERNKLLGHWENSDTLRRIVRVSEGGGQTFIFEVEWEKRKDGNRPKNSLVTNWEFRKHEPCSLLDYYERRIKIGKKSKQ